MSKHDIIILGCGPAGLLAAHAAAMQGLDFKIVSIKEQSPMSGAQYLHQEIPGITGEPFTVTFKKLGSRAGYAINTYGSRFAPVSWDLWEEGPRPAWPLPEAYDKLWDLYSGEIESEWVTAEMIPSLYKQTDLLVSTVPRRSLCTDPEGHHFHGQRVWISDEAHETCEPNTIIYNGLQKRRWYRSSLINGIGSTESRIEHDGWIPGVKPLKTNCNCHPHVFFRGRFGAWQKNVLLHHVFNQMDRMTTSYVQHNRSHHALQ